MNSPSPLEYLGLLAFFGVFALVLWPLGRRRRFSHQRAVLVTVVGYLFFFVPGVLLNLAYVIRGERLRRAYGRAPWGHGLLVGMLGLSILLGWALFRMASMRHARLPLSASELALRPSEPLLAYGVLGTLALLFAIRGVWLRFCHGEGKEGSSQRLTALWLDLRAAQGTRGVERVIRVHAILEKALLILVGDAQDPKPDFTELIQRAAARGIVRPEDAGLLRYARSVRNRIAHENLGDGAEIADAGRVYLSLAGYVLGAHSRAPSLPWAALITVAACAAAGAEILLRPGTFLTGLIMAWSHLGRMFHS